MSDRCEQCGSTPNPDGSCACNPVKTTNKMQVHCFYHRSDLDGHCSGAIVRRWCESVNADFVPHGVNYGDVIDWFAGEGPDNKAVICDFTPEGDDARSILNGMDLRYGHGLIWIDHHKTAVERVGNLAIVSGRRSIDRAACVLTWEFFYPRCQMPLSVEWMGKYDIFDRSDDHAWRFDILPFQYGIKMMQTNPDGTDEKCLWYLLLNDDRAVTYSTHARGAIAFECETENNRKTAKAAAYDCMFEGRLCCAINARGNSLVLESAKRPEHMMLILWGFTQGKWHVSLFENGHSDIDCGLIAKKYGGGGHKGAAGFEVKSGYSSPIDLFIPVEVKV